MTTETKTTMKKKYAVIGVSTTVVVALVLGLSLGLTSKNKNNNSSSQKAKIFQVNLPTYDSILSFDEKGYSQFSDLVQDIEEALKYIANVQIDRNARYRFNNFDFFQYEPRGGWVMTVDDSVDVMENTDVAGPMAGAADPGESNKGESSFGTNNQVDNVEEGDTVKSDGNYVFSAYGDQVVIWNAKSGQELTRTILPTSDDSGIDLCDTTTTTSSPKEPCYSSYGQKMNIVSLLLYQNRLVVIANAPFYVPSTMLQGYHATRAYIYNTTTIQDELPLIQQIDIQGYYKSSRSIDDNVHIVTSSYVSTWEMFESKFDIWNYSIFDDDLTENEYRVIAYDIANDLIPKVAIKLAKEVFTTSGCDTLSSCPKLSKIAIMTKQKSQKQDTDVIPSFSNSGVLNSFVQVSSFSINVVDTPSVSTSGIFLPAASYTSNIYASSEKLVVTGEAYYEDGDGEWRESTVVVAFLIDGSTTLLHSIGEVPGSLLNQFSMDIFTDELDVDYFRVATTMWSKWGMVGDVWTQVSESESLVSVFELPSDLSNSTEMKLVGTVEDLGKGERIYAVRFMGKKGFVVTFRQVDPLYTIDLSDPSNPIAVGELKIPGFSNYLHPIDDEANFIIGVGQDANDNGIIQGLQITLFNVTTLSNPQQINKYVESSGSGSYSDVQYDHKAFRYLPESQMLILPASYYGKESFDGFIVYDVDYTKKFSKWFEISHSSSQDVWYGCGNWFQLPSRSLVFDGNVTTLKGQTVLSHDLATKEKLWSLDVDDGGNDNSFVDCYVY